MNPNHRAALANLAEHFNKGPALDFVQKSIWNLAVEKKQQAKLRRKEEKKALKVLQTIV